MPRSLASEGIKFTILTTKPADPAAPTATELNAGIDASCKVSRENFAWTPADSDTVDDPELCSTSKAVAPSYDNYNLSMQVYRYWLDEGGVDPTADALFAAIKDKGTTLWGYTRHTAQPYSDDWAAGDPIDLGAEFWTDWPQDPYGGGWLKYRVPVHANAGWPQITVASV